MGSDPGATGTDAGTNAGGTARAAEPDDWTVPDDVLELDALHEVLGHPRRRYLAYTLQKSEAWTLMDLARRVAAWEQGVDESAVSDDVRQRAYVSLHHTHVPTLREHGVIEFDADAETITAGPHARQVLAAFEGVGASLDSAQETHARGERDD